METIVKLPVSSGDSELAFDACVPRQWSTLSDTPLMSD